MALHAAAYAAGKIFGHVLVFMAHAAADRHHVTGATVFRIDRAEHMIEQGALFELGILDVRMDREERARHLQNVIDVAAFIGAAVDAFIQLVRWPKVFIAAMTAGRVAVMQRDGIPKESSGLAIGFLAGVDVAH